MKLFLMRPADFYFPRLSKVLVGCTFGLLLLVPLLLIAVLGSCGGTLPRKSRSTFGIGGRGGTPPELMLPLPPQMSLKMYPVMPKARKLIAVPLMI